VLFCIQFNLIFPFWTGAAFLLFAVAIFIRSATNSRKGEAEDKKEKEISQKGLHEWTLIDDLWRR
jgi:Na+/H+ antiporter NhaC